MRWALIAVWLFIIVGLPTIVIWTAIDSPSQPTPPQPTAVLATVVGKHTQVTSVAPGIPICSGRPQICIASPAGKGTAYILALKKDDGTLASATVSPKTYDRASAGMRFNVTKNTLVLTGNE